MDSAQNNRSEVRSLLNQIREEYEAAQLGLSGLASGTSKHAFITAKMERIGKWHGELQEIVGEEEALALIVDELDDRLGPTRSSVQEGYEETHTVLEQIQGAEVPVPSLPLAVPEQLQLGRTRIIVDNQEFIQAIGYGLESRFECWNEREQMSAQALFERWMKIIKEERFEGQDETVSYEWRLGFIVGEMAGLLNPDLENENAGLSYLQALSRECQRRYQELA